MTPSDSRLDRRPERRRRGCWPRPQRVSPVARITFPACHAHYPGESVGGARRLLAHPCCLPRHSAGSASAISLSRPTQASLALWPAGLLDRPRRPLSRGFGPVSYPTQPLVSYQTYRQLSGWNLPPLVIRAIGAHWMATATGSRQPRRRNGDQLTGMAKIQKHQTKEIPPPKSKSVQK